MAGASERQMFQFELLTKRDWAIIAVSFIAAVCLLVFGVNWLYHHLALPG
jgi:undecaprenyl pyrophosphate phosphatase UppP